MVANAEFGERMERLSQAVKESGLGAFIVTGQESTPRPV
jgi:hypothetical protein